MGLFFKGKKGNAPDKLGDPMRKTSRNAQVHEEDFPIHSLDEVESEEEAEELYFRALAIADPKKRAAALLPFAEAGWTDAMLELALAKEKCNESEEAMSWIMQEVMPWIIRAAKAGNPVAYYEWGKRILETTANLSDELSWDAKKSFLEEGLSRWCFAAGVGVHKAVQALTVYNHMENEAAYQVVQPILDRALGMVAKSLDEHETEPRTQYTKGLWYFYGVGYEQDLDQARSWLEKAAAAGYADAAEMLKNPLLEEY